MSVTAPSSRTSPRAIGRHGRSKTGVDHESGPSRRMAGGQRRVTQSVVYHWKDCIQTPFGGLAFVELFKATGEKRWAEYARRFALTCKRPNCRMGRGDGWAGMG